MKESIPLENSEKRNLMQIYLAIYAIAVFYKNLNSMLRFLME